MNINIATSLSRNDTLHIGFLKRSNSSFPINGRRFEQLLQYQVRHGISHGKHVFLYVITENF